jgi:acetylglutamate synthase
VGHKHQARQQGQRKKKWLMVYISDEQNFECLAFTRDILKNDTVSLSVFSRALYLGLL